MKQYFTCEIKNNEKSAILMMTVGVMIIVAMLALALIMLSTSQLFLVQTQKKGLKGFYAAEAQVLWAASKIQEDPNYDGGNSGDDIYIIDADDDGINDAEEIVIAIECTTKPVANLYDMAVGKIDSITDTFEVKTYVKYAGIFGKKESAVQLNATIERIVNQISPGEFKITTRVIDWEQKKPPKCPD